MSITGTWQLTMNTPFGVQTPLLKIAQEQDSFVGSLDGQSGSSPIEGFSVNDNQLEFKTQVVTPMGSVPVSFNATVSGDSMKGVYQTMLGKTEFSGARAA